MANFGAVELTNGPADTMNRVISAVLRVGVLLAALVISGGTVLLIAKGGLMDGGALLTYSPARVPHGAFDPSLSGIVGGLATLDPNSIIELGVLLLLATPAARVVLSVYLFAVEGDRAFFYITVTVLILLTFSMLLTPFIPGFNG